MNFVKMKHFTKSTAGFFSGGADTQIGFTDLFTYLHSLHAPEGSVGKMYANGFACSDRNNPDHLIECESFGQTFLLV